MNQNAEKRKTARDESLNNLYQMLRGLQVSLSKQIADLHGRLDEHMRNEEAGMRRLTDEIEALTALHRAFPQLEDGTPDLHGHRTDHEERMREAEEVRELKRAGKKAVVETVTKWGLHLFYLGAVGYVVSHISGGH